MKKNYSTLKYIFICLLAASFASIVYSPPVNAASQSNTNSSAPLSTKYLSNIFLYTLYELGAVFLIERCFIAGLFWFVSFLALPIMKLTAVFFLFHFAHRCLYWKNSHLLQEALKQDISGVQWILWQASNIIDQLSTKKPASRVK